MSYNSFLYFGLYSYLSRTVSSACYWSVNALIDLASATKLIVLWCRRYKIGLSMWWKWMCTDIDDRSLHGLGAGFSDISTWMTEHHLQLILSKAGLLVIPAARAAYHCLNLTWVRQSSDQVRSKFDRHSGFYVGTWPEPDAVIVSWSTEFVLPGHSLTVYPDYTSVGTL